MNTLIVVIEDDNEIRDYVTQVLVDHGYLVKSAASGVEGIKTVEKHSPELVLLDLKLPDISGEALCRQFKEDFPEIKIMILTAKDTPEDIARGLNIGADDYLSKPFAPQELLARIAARLRSSGQTDALEIADLVLNPKTHEVTRSGQPIDLSPQEFKLLHYLMNNANQVLNREMILSHIWGAATDVETRVVDVYIGYLRKKIDKPFSKPLIKSVRGFGYIIKAE